ncbi:ankyrin repeat protein [Bacteriovorax sp. BAL6_X]|uniref:ankyrin repeat domain-containing protein n=1 Tax=Bacteriovorax sp. BAL6_X TaxID=1201290 RepID=UPI0003867BCD|nr:ankyrin repeat domain-containing protein [Bacteriovorax sp. BAL6_X]EPZ49961.1 ankyrin repeat protein [Bacteriovorax sp. BAL6_X]
MSKIFDWAQNGDVGELSIFLLTNEECNLEVTNEKGYTPLLEATQNGHFEFCHSLLSAGASPKATDGLGNNALMLACLKGNLKIVKLLIQYGAKLGELNDSGMSAHDWAMAFNRKQVASFISEKHKFQNNRFKSYLGLVKNGMKSISWPNRKSL